MRNGHIQSAKTELERLQKQGNKAANWRAAEQRVALLNNRRNTPLQAKKKATPFYRCRRTERSKELLKLLLSHV